MQSLVRLSIRRAVFAAVLMLVIVVVGLAAYGRLGLDQFPNVDLPYVIVTTRLAGASPEVIESDVTDKLEGAINTISGIDELRSTSSEGVSQVVVAFVLDKDGDTATQEIRDRVNAVLPDLPRGIGPPVVSRLDAGSGAILLLAVRGGASVRALTDVAERTVKRRLESLDGVGQVTVIGGRRRQIDVWLDPVRLRAHALGAPDIGRALSAANLSEPGGNIEAGPERVSVRVDGRVRTPRELGRVVVAMRERHPIRVDDVARVEDGQEEELSYAALGDDRAVVLSVRKQSGENTVTVVDAVKERLREIGAALRPGVRLDIVRDNSEVVRTGVGTVKEHLVFGGLLAALVVLVFLGDARSTLISAIAIPVSIIGTFAVMKAAGFTLNFLTLLALALSVGIVIDDAIVVLENIARYVHEKGMKPFPAAALATREIGPAVVATTLSLMVVFVPVAFMSGMAGRFMGSFGLTIAFAIGVSMLVSFTITPALAARLLRPRAGVRPPGRLARAVDAGYKPIERLYMRILAACLRRRWVVVAACLLSVVSTPVIMRAVPGGFLPPDDQAQFEVNLRAPEGSSLEATRLVSTRLAGQIRAHAGVAQTLLTIGEGEQSAPNIARIYVLLTAPESREETQAAIMQLVREQLFPRLPAGYRATAGEVQPFSTGMSAANVALAMRGPDLDELSRHATRVTEALKKAPGAVDVDNTLVVGRPELRARVDRDRAAVLGVRVADVADTLRTMVSGLKVTSYTEAGEEYEVRLRADAGFRVSAEALGVVPVPSFHDDAVPLAAVATFARETGPAEINRLDRQRQITITANSAPGVGDSAVQDALERLIAAEHLPAGYSAQLVGKSKEQARMSGSFGLVFGLAFVFMYLVLAAQFDSWLHPITILLSLPLTLPFALVSLLLFGETLNLFSSLGLLVLFGVVKKNAILQIDHTNALRAAGQARLPAILHANRERLRPILMTTVAFVAGMVPMLLSRGIGSAQSRTTGAIVFGGQTLSLLLTLVAVPVAYSLFDDLSVWVRGRLRLGERRDRGERELEVLFPTDRGQAAALAPDVQEQAV